MLRVDAIHKRRAIIDRRAVADGLASGLARCADFADRRRLLADTLRGALLAGRTEIAERLAATAQALDATGAQVVVLARSGQDLSKYRLRWSHLGLAYRDGGGWKVVHKLNQCGSARADLYRQGLGEFFLDDPHEFAAAFSVLSAEAQQKLIKGDKKLKDNLKPLSSKVDMLQKKIGELRDKTLGYVTHSNYITHHLQLDI
jgi:hypothetical protein